MGGMESEARRCGEEQVMQSCVNFSVTMKNVGSTWSDFSVYYKIRIAFITSLGARTRKPNYGTTSNGRGISTPFKCSVFALA